jgi:molybdopterin synthase sulfur carrier subunit
MNLVSIRMPSQLARLYHTQRWEEVEATTVGEAIQVLEARFPGIAARLIEPDGRVRRWINIFVDEWDIRNLQELETPLLPGTQVYIVPSVAGGSSS